FRHNTSGCAFANQATSRASRARTELMFQVASFTDHRTYIGPPGRRACNLEGIAASTDLLDRWLDRHTPSHVRIPMKAPNDLSLWSIIERLQRRLERQGMRPAEADRAVAIAVRHLAL